MGLVLFWSPSGCHQLVPSQYMSVRLGKSTGCVGKALHGSAEVVEVLVFNCPGNVVLNVVVLVIGVLVVALLDDGVSDVAVLAVVMSDVVVLDSLVLIEVAFDVKMLSVVVVDDNRLDDGRLVDDKPDADELDDEGADFASEVCEETCLVDWSGLQWWSRIQYLMRMWMSSLASWTWWM